MPEFFFPEKCMHTKGEQIFFSSSFYVHRLGPDQPEDQHCWSGLCYWLKMHLLAVTEVDLRVFFMSFMALSFTKPKQILIRIFFTL